MNEQPSRSLAKALRKRAILLYDNSRLAKVHNWLAALGRPDAVFIWIPKNAGTSLRKALHAPNLKSLHRIRARFAGRGVVTFAHMDYRGLVEAGYVPPGFDRGAYKFAFTRDPYDRAVSLFFYLRRRALLPPGQDFLGFARMLAEHGCEPIGLYNRLGLSMCNPQVRWIERVDMDFVGRYETLAQDTLHVMTHLGLPATDLPRLNTGRRTSYARYYCPESRECIQSFYREDFAYLGHPPFDADSPSATDPPPAPAEPLALAQGH